MFIIIIIIILYLLNYVYHQNDFLLIYDSMNVQSPPKLEYWPRTDVRTLKVMFEYFNFRIKNNFKQKSFWIKIQFLIKSCNQGPTLSIQLLQLPLNTPFLYFFVKNYPSQKHVHNFCPLSPLCWKKRTREKRGSWFDPLHSGGLNYSEKIKNWSWIFGLRIILILGLRIILTLGLRIILVWDLIFETDSRGGDLHSLVRFRIRRHDFRVKRNMATTTGN